MAEDADAPREEDEEAAGAVNEETGEEGGEDGGEKAPKSSKKKLIMFAGLGLILLGGIGGGAGYFLGMFGGEEEAPAVAQAKPAVFYDLPDVTVNLASVDQRPRFLQLKVALEVSSSDTIDAISPLLPRVMDTFQVYLRELRVADLEGSAGIYRLKEELRKRINLAVHPAQVDDILFKELLIRKFP
jgi:flagellar FliL protein